MSARLVFRLSTFTLLCLVVGCDLDDGAMVECRCVPETNINLFPCPLMTIVEKHEISAAGDTLSTETSWILQGDTLSAKIQRIIAEVGGTTLSPEADWIIAKGDMIHLNHPGSGNPFASQIPDCPSGQLIFLREPTRPENVLANMRTIFQDPTRNLGQYMDQLAEDFTFVPDELDVQLHPEVYDVDRDTLWNREQELRFAQSIFDPDRIETIHFTRWYKSTTDERIPSEDQLSETFVFPYEVEFVEKSRDQEQANLLAIKGWMELDLVTPTVENPVWTIRQWRDLRDPATAKRSWGELRAEFAR